MKHLEKAFIGNNHFLLYVAVIVIVLVAQGFISAILMGIIVFSNISSPNELIGADAMSLLKSIDSNITLTVLMIPMALSFILILILIKAIHGRTFAEVVNGTKQTRWQRVFYGFAIWFVIMAISSIAQYLASPEVFILQFSLKKFIPLILISLALIPFQTTFEEVMTRGYLAQGVGTLTGNRWLAFLIPAFFFTVLHLFNPEIKEHGFWIMLFTYLAMSLIWGLVAILDDGIELAIGMHAANNIFISLFTSQKGAAFETDAVFAITKSNPYLDFVILLIAGGIAIAIFYKKYDWSFNTLNTKIENPNSKTISVS